MEASRSRTKEALEMLARVMRNQYDEGNYTKWFSLFVSEELSSTFSDASPSGGLDYPT